MRAMSWPALQRFGTESTYEYCIHGAADADEGAGGGFCRGEHIRNKNEKICTHSKRTTRYEVTQKLGFESLTYAHTHIGYPVTYCYRD